MQDAVFKALRMKRKHIVNAGNTMYAAIMESGKQVLVNIHSIESCKYHTENDNKKLSFNM